MFDFDPNFSGKFNKVRNCVFLIILQEHGKNNGLLTLSIFPEKLGVEIEKKNRTQFFGLGDFATKLNFDQNYPRGKGALGATFIWQKVNLKNTPFEIWIFGVSNRHNFRVHGFVIMLVCS